MTAARRGALSALARQRPTTVLEDVTVPRNKLTEILKFIKSTAEKYDLTIGIFGHIGDGNIHPTCLTDERNDEELARVEQAFDEIYRKTSELGGTITGEHGVGIAKRKFFKKYTDPNLLEIMKGIKKVFDLTDNLHLPFSRDLSNLFQKSFHFQNDQKSSNPKVTFNDKSVRNDGLNEIIPNGLIKKNKQPIEKKDQGESFFEKYNHDEVMKKVDSLQFQHKEKSLKHFDEKNNE